MRTNPFSTRRGTFPSVSADTCSEALGLLKSEDTSKGRWLHVPTREVGKSLESELRNRLFLYVSSRGAAVYQQPSAGWEELMNAFPSTAFDIDESSKCLALNRNTGCVFHLMPRKSGTLSRGRPLPGQAGDATRFLRGQ